MTTKNEILEYLDNVLHPLVSPEHWNVYSELHDMAEDLPEPIKRGHWTKIAPAPIYECSVCHLNVMTRDIAVYRFCHHCGARMYG